MSQAYTFIALGIVVAWALGFILWVVALRLKRRPANDYVLAIAVTLIGLYCSYSLYVLCTAFRPSEISLRVACESNLKLIGLGLLQYSVDNDEHFPPANQWATAIKLYTSFHNVPRLYHCPKAQAPFSYAFNKSLNLLPQQGEFESRFLVMTFESNSKSINANGSNTDLCLPRHQGKSNFGFADGHVQSYGQTGPFGYESAGSVNWNPQGIESQLLTHKNTKTK